jgi:hypothetical protein
MITAGTTSRSQVLVDKLEKRAFMTLTVMNTDDVPRMFPARKTCKPQRTQAEHKT